MAIQSRWYSEPLRNLLIPFTTFVRNAKGYPVLPKSHQALISRYMRLRQPPWILLGDVGPIPSVLPQKQDVENFDSLAQTADSASMMIDSGLASPTPAEASRQLKTPGAQRHKDPTPYLSYIRHLQRNQPPKPAIERFGAGYQDYLQAPLQPLADNLESVTYEVFETDPIKYDWYERAIAHALAEWFLRAKTTSSGTEELRLAVVGAGRGPLVTRALKASQSTGAALKVWALEKNPSAYVLLQRHNVHQWGGEVTVVKTDMRAWRGPQLPDGSYGKVDILVSELLGSFGDNELSPECLDGVQHVLNPEDGISIPASYTAHLTPIAAPKLYAAIHERAINDKSAFETPYVVMLHAVDYLSSTIQDAQQQDSRERSARGLEQPALPLVQQAWSFEHPAQSAILQGNNASTADLSMGAGNFTNGPDAGNTHNARFARMRFPCRDRGVCHGLAGYFETVLYHAVEGPVELSTNPVTMDAKSKDMISWFPMFFPLKVCWSPTNCMPIHEANLTFLQVPIYFPDQSELVISMWRQTDDRKVWYEWLVETFAVLGEQHVRLAVSDLHSSVKNGCLM